MQGHPADPSETATATKPVPLRVTDAALVQVMSILHAEADPDSLGLRVAVTGTRGVEQGRLCDPVLGASVLVPSDDPIAGTYAAGTEGHDRTSVTKGIKTSHSPIAENST